MSQKTGLMAAVAAAADMSNSETPIEVTAALISAHFPEVAATLRAEGVDAEHARLAGIEAMALPGHEGIIAAHKADRSKQPVDAARAILAAERGQRASVVEGLAKDEATMQGLRSQPANMGAMPAQPFAGLSGEDLWKAEFASNADMAASFGNDEKTYLAFKRAEARGVVKILERQRPAKAE